MSLKNCQHCSCYEGRYSIQPVEGLVFISSGDGFVLGDHYGICKAGHNDTLVKWWRDNGKLPAGEGEECMCYQPTKFDQALDKCLDCCNKILERNKNEQT